MGHGVLERRACSRGAVSALAAAVVICTIVSSLAIEESISPAIRPPCSTMMRCAKRMTSGRSDDAKRIANATRNGRLRRACRFRRWLPSDAGILLRVAGERRLGISHRLADCIEEPRAAERML